jgi:hypothetical protein
MYAYSTGIGRDRGGMMFRYAAYDMLNRLDLEEGFSGGTNVKHSNKEGNAYSRALWGIYCFER